MGAVSLRATFRSVRIIARMTPEDAKQLGLPTPQAWRYTRISGSKENYAPPPELTTWYKLESVALANGDQSYPEGDDVQVATVWTPPSTFDGLLRSVIAEIFAAIRIPPGLGLQWSSDRRTDQWVGSPIARITGKNADQIPPIIRSWIKNQVLIKGDYQHPATYKTLACVTLNETKAGEILGPLYFRETDDEQ
jgi:hypothetical protein